MRARVEKWGNSLAVRIPDALANAAGIEPDMAVDVFMRNGEMVIAPVRSVYTLEQLVNQITEQNRHGEQPFGERQEGEAW